MSFEEWWNNQELGAPTMVFNTEEDMARAAYSAGVAAERERTQPYIYQLEQAWLQITRGNLIDGGMQVEQARIHAQPMLDDAKHKILAAAIRGEVDSGTT